MRRTGFVIDIRVGIQLRNTLLQFSLFKSWQEICRGLKSRHYAKYYVGTMEIFMLRECHCLMSNQRCFSKLETEKELRFLIAAVNKYERDNRQC